MRAHNRVFKKALRGDKEAYGQVYNLLVEKIYRFIYFKVSSHEEAQDLTHETFLKSWQYLSKKEVKNLNALLYGVARNLVIDFYRNKSQRSLLIASQEELKKIRDPQEGPEERIAQESEIREIKKSLRNLKEEYQEVIVLRYLNELSIKETAKVLEKSQVGVRVLLHRALRALRAIMMSKER